MRIAAKFTLTALLIGCSPLDEAKNILRELGEKGGRVSHGPIRASSPSDTNWMAIVGDSGTTGALASPRFRPTLASLGDYLLDDDAARPRLEEIPNPEKFRIHSLEPMNRVYYTEEEEKESAEDPGLSAMAAEKLDVKEYSFGYFVGRHRNLFPENIFLVGQDGARVDSIARQFARLKETGFIDLPPLVLVSYTANDLCGDEIFNEPPETLVQQFKEEITHQMKEVIADNRPRTTGTHIVILAPLDVAKVLSDEHLLSQKIEFEGIGEISCMDLRQGKNEKASLATEKLRERLMGMCRSVLEIKPNEKHKIDRIRKLQDGFSAAWMDLIAELRRDHEGKGFTFDYVESVRYLRAEPGDLANDCFHPSVRFHQKIAEEVLKLLYQTE